VKSSQPAASITRRRHLITRISASAAIILLSACGGTRLPDSAFSQLSVQAGGQSTTGPGTTGANGLPSGGGPGTGSTGLPSGGGPGGSSTGGAGPSGGSNGSGPGGGPNGTSSTGPNGGGGSAGQGNTASDTGVTASQITVCNVVTQGGPFGPYQFTPNYYGAAAYFASLNAAGGVHGRSIKFVSHPDDGSDSGNLSQIHTCIDTDKAFAFVSNNVYQYGGASYVNSKGVPDIGGAPISSAYYIYPHLFAIYGDHVPRDGHTLGEHGYNYRTDQDALFFKQHIHVHHVGVVYYDQSSSQYGANNIAQEFRTAGVKVSMYQVNLGLANYGSAVAQMKADGVDLVADAIDLNGSQHLCQAIEQNSSFLHQMKAKLSTVANWTQSLGHDLAQTPGCLAKSWADSTSANFADTSNPQVKKFQAAMHKYFPNDIPHNHQFALEGYAGAMWFTDAVRSCGAKVTRTCVEKYMNRPKPWSGRGLMETPLTGFQKFDYSGTHRQCVSAAQWSRSANTWVTRASLTHTCYNAKGFRYQLTAPT
jgi:branched-chain amino acid transport system substrate-binding protein